MPEHPEDAASLDPAAVGSVDTGRSRWLLWGPALAVVAVVAVAAGTILLVRGGGGAGSGEPPVIRLADGAADGAAAATLPEAPALGNAGPVRIAGQLPTGPASAAARTLPAGPAPEATVTRLARVLGLNGTPAHTDQGWRVVDGARTLQVADTPGMPWGLLPAVGYEICVGRVDDPAAAPPCPVYRGPVVVAPPAEPGHKNPGGNAGGPVSGTGGGSSGSSGSAGTGVVTDPATPATPGGRVEPGGPQTVPPPGKPANDGATGGGSGPAATGSAGTGSGSASTPQGQDGSVTGVPAPPGKTIPAPPPPTLPTDPDALAAARSVLDVLGLTDARTRVDRTGPLVAVVADPVIDGLVTDGYATTLLLDAHGAVKGAGGWLAHPATGATYPLVTASDALKTVVVPAIARLCGTKACPQQPLEVTGAELALTLRYQANPSTPILLPAWRYTVRDRPTPLILVAVQPKYLGAPTGRPNVPGGAPPPNADPNGKANNGGPAPGAPANPNTGQGGAPANPGAGTGSQPANPAATEPASPPTHN